MVIPKLVNVEEVCRQSENKFTKFADPKLARQIQFMLNLLQLSEDDKLKSLLKKIEISQQASNIILQYVLKNEKIDYTAVWYKWLKRKINEFHYRYLRKELIKEDTVEDYKNLFKTFILISTETDVLFSEDAGNELGYFIAAQLSNRFSLKQGMRVKPTTRLFCYSTAYSIYKEYKNLGCIPSTTKPFDHFIHNFDTKLLKSIYKLEDHENSYFLNVGVPVIKAKIPNISRKSYNWLDSYIYTLEYLIIREKILNRKLNRILLSIEHLRAHNRLLNVTK